MLRRWSYGGEMAAMRKPAFRGRIRERQALDHLLVSVRGGESAVRVLRGEAGIGKTALLRYCARQAAGCQLAQIAGVESELALPWAALHQLCAPLLDGLPALPEPQQQALPAGLRDGAWRCAGPVLGRTGACWACSPRRVLSARWCAWSTTPSGLTTRPHGYWASSHAACWASPSPFSSPSGRWATNGGSPVYPR